MAKIQYYIGNVKSGKSYRMYSRSDLSIIIVPEQYAMQSQADLLNIKKSDVILSPKIYSFKRLSYEILDKNSSSQYKQIDEVAKAILLRRLSFGISEDDFYINISKSGNIAKLKSVISEFEQYNVSLADIEKVIESIPKAVPDYKRLKYLSKIYKKYIDYLQENDICFDILEVSRQIIEKKPIFKDLVIAFDDFNGFTFSQLNFIKTLFHQADTLIFSLNIEKIELLNNSKDSFDSRLFYPAIRTYKSLQKIFEFQKAEFIECKECKFNKFTSIKDNFLRDREIYTTELKNARNIDEKKPHIYEFLSIIDEVQFICDKIMDLINNEKFSYFDIAIVVSDENTYFRLLSEYFKKYKIPFSIDKSDSIENHILVTFIISALRVIDSKFSNFFVRNFVKHPMLNFDNEKKEEFENLCIKTGIYGKKAFEKLNLDNDNSDIIKGKYIVDILQPLIDIFQNKICNIEKINNAIMEILKICDVKNSAQNISEYLYDLDKDKFLSDFDEVYDMVVEIFEKMNMVSYDCQVSTEEYIDMLQAGFQISKLSKLPDRYDSVIIRDLIRSKHKRNFKAVFVVGMNDNLLPTIRASNALLPDRLKQYFFDKDIFLSDNNAIDIMIQSYELYRCLLMSDKYLYMTYPTKNILSDVLKPSYFIDELCDILNIQIKNIIYKNAKNNENVKNIYESIKDIDLPKKLSQKLYEKKNFSITQLEKFAACKFSHFCKYALRLKMRPVFEPNIMDFGQILHAAMENVGRIQLNKNQNFRNLSDDDIKILSFEALTSAINESKLSGEYIKGRHRVLKRRILKLIKNAVKIQNIQMEQGLFHLYSLEKKFEIPLIDDRKIYGKIDRIDWYKNAVRVLDYKMGIKNFEMKFFEVGLQLQLPLYLKAATYLTALENNIDLKKIVPAGMFYSTLSDPIVDSNIDILKERLKLLRLQGLFNIQKDVLFALDNGFYEDVNNDLKSSSFMSYVIKAKLKKNREFDAHTDINNTESLNDTMNKAITISRNFSDEILNGKIKINPINLMKKYFACEHCEYKDVCGIDEDLKNGSIRYL